MNFTKIDTKCDTQSVTFYNFIVVCFILFRSHTGWTHRRVELSVYFFNSRQTVAASEQIAEINLTLPDWRRQLVIWGCRRNIGDPWRAIVRQAGRQQSVSSTHLSQARTMQHLADETPFINIQRNAVSWPNTYICWNKFAKTLTTIRPANAAW